MLFPGLGVDGGVFDLQRTLPARVETPGWIDPDPDDTVESYSARMARRVPLDPQDNAPLYLGGLSFGGMVALEAAKILRPRGVFLMSCGYSWRCLAPAVRVMLAGCGATPPGVLKEMVRLTPLFVRVVGHPDRRQRRRILDLVPRVNADVCAWGARAMLRWTYRGPCPAPVHHIHGAIDRIVPPERVRPDAVVPGAGHALNVTHPAVVNEFIASRMRADFPDAGQCLESRPEAS